jgi:hypothetical protein
LLHNFDYFMGFQYSPTYIQSILIPSPPWLYILISLCLFIFTKNTFGTQIC